MPSMNSRTAHTSRVRRLTTLVGAWSLGIAAAVGATLGFVTLQDAQNSNVVSDVLTPNSQARPEFSVQSSSPLPAPVTTDQTTDPATDRTTDPATDRTTDVTTDQTTAESAPLNGGMTRSGAS